MSIDFFVTDSQFTFDNISRYCRLHNKPNTKESIDSLIQSHKAGKIQLPHDFLVSYLERSQDVELMSLHHWQDRDVADWIIYHAKTMDLYILHYLNQFDKDYQQKILKQAFRKMCKSEAEFMYALPHLKRLGFRISNHTKKSLPKLTEKMSAAWEQLLLSKEIAPSPKKSTFKL